MQSKEVLSGAEMRSKILKGIDFVANPIRSTVGPGGMNNGIEVLFGRPKVSNDALTFAKEAVCEDKFENLGASFTTIVAQDTDSIAKGGRSTAVLLFQELYRKAINLIASGSKPTKIRKGMDLALEEVLQQLKKSSRAIKMDEVEKIATISSESPESGKLIATIIKEVGQDGAVTVETGGTETTHEIVKGFDFKQGFASPYFITDPQRQTARLDNCLVLITEKKLSSIQDVLPILNKLHEAGEKKLFIIAEDIESDALATLIKNRLLGIFDIIAVKAPEWGNYRKQILEDIAYLTGTNVITELNDVNPEDLGRIKNVMVDKERTILIGDRDVKGKIKMLKYELSKELDGVEKDRLKSRIAKLSAGVAVIYVGSYTETDMNYKKQKMEDGVKEAQTALEYGIVTGGGTALAKIKLTGMNEDKDIQAGYNIVKESLSSPLKQIVDNAEDRSGEVVLNEILQSKKKYFGYNAETDEFVDDMFEEGIIDSLKSTVSAMTNAVNQTGIVITIGSSMVHKGEPEKLNSNGQIV